MSYKITAETTIGGYGDIPSATLTITPLSDRDDILRLRLVSYDEFGTRGEVTAAVNAQDVAILIDMLQVVSSRLAGH